MLGCFYSRFNVLKYRKLEKQRNYEEIMFWCFYLVFTCKFFIFFECHLFVLKKDCIWALTKHSSQDVNVSTFRGAWCNWLCSSPQQWRPPRWLWSWQELLALVRSSGPLGACPGRNSKEKAGHTVQWAEEHEQQTFLEARLGSWEKEHAWAHMRFSTGLCAASQGY